MTKTLLEQAKAIPIKSKDKGISEEEIELALEWLTDGVSITAVSQVLNYKTAGNALNRLALVLREGCRRGSIKVEKRK